MDCPSRVQEEAPKRRHKLDTKGERHEARAHHSSTRGARMAHHHEGQPRRQLARP
eukprot:SAG31_NODE_691_length_12779_cov_19.035095_11_plen_55_part_00